MVISNVWGGGAMVQPHPWSYREFFDNFCTVFASFVLRLSREIRVACPKAYRLVTVGVFLPVKNRVKMHTDIILGTKNDFFSGGDGPALLYTPPISAPTTPRPLLKS